MRRNLTFGLLSGRCYVRTQRDLRLEIGEPALLAE